MDAAASTTIASGSANMSARRTAVSTITVPSLRAIEATARPRSRPMPKNPARSMERRFEDSPTWLWYPCRRHLKPLFATALDKCSESTIYG